MYDVLGRYVAPSYCVTVGPIIVSQHRTAIGAWVSARYNKGRVCRFDGIQVGPVLTKGKVHEIINMESSSRYHGRSTDF